MLSLRHHLRVTLRLALASTLLLAAARAEPVPATEQRIRAHVTFLASDLLEGRGTGTRGHELAMAYVAAQFARLGLQPAGTDGFRQDITFRESRLDLSSGRLVLRGPDGEQALTMVTEAMVRPAGSRTAAEVSAPAVFVGFGIHAPEFGYDDFAGGVDLQGKIAVMLSGSPARLPATARAHYSRARTTDLVRRGAVGIVTLETPSEERRTPWAVNANRGRFPTMQLIQPDGTLFNTGTMTGETEATRRLQASAAVSRAAAAHFFRHAPRSIAEVFAAAERNEPQAFALGVDVSLAAKADVSDVRSANVLALLPGSDAALAAEPLVVTAHLDHLGIGPAVDGDTIYNGALDNALGTAVILAAAETLAQAPRPRRPILFASLTGEEKGLLGAFHLARHLPAGVRRAAANVNIDMPILLGPTRDVIGLGAEHSTLGGVLRTTAARLQFTVSPDSQPEEVLFVRSDQYPFIRTGVPALALKAGSKPSAGDMDLAAREKEFRRTRYHKPSDDLSQPIHWESAAAFATFATALMQDIANQAEAPQWLEGDFFGTRFGPARGP